MNTAFSAYELIYYPSPEEQANLNDKWWRARAVTMPAFLHSVGSRLHASDDQIVARIRKYVVPFDAAVADQLGVSGSSALAICQWIGQRLQQALDDATHAVKAESEARAILLAEAAQQRWGLQEVRAAVTRPAYSAKLRTLLKEISSAGKVSLDDLREAFPSTAETFWQRFSVGRGEGPHIEYPTERSVSNERPLIKPSQGEAVCPSFGELLLAVLEVSERCLGEGSHRASFFRARDKTLEDEARKPLESLLGGTCTLHANLFETPNHHHEHDLVVMSDDLCLIVEMKASPPPEPFRDPDKAFVRLRQAFGADTGIQGAYEQALRVWRRLRAGETITLYDERGKVALEIPPATLRYTYCVCVTRDDFGPLAADLALLLDRRGEDPYPWAVNVLDLENLAEAWEYFGWGAKQLGDYLAQRLKLHGRVFCDDELDIAGFFIRHRGLGSLLRGAPLAIPLKPSYSNIFDRIYFHLHYGGPPVDMESTEPAMYSGTLMEPSRQSFAEPSHNVDVRRVGRNDPCPCGSGRKYKKCCQRRMPE